MTVEGALLSDLVGRLATEPKASTFELHVLAAFEGKGALAQLLESETPPARATAPGSAPPEPRGAYLKSISVEGFRGVGPRQTLDLPAGPGLTLVVGRNGSGKSSFAEGLELLCTGDTFRWRKRSKVWRDGWRNLHHATAAVEAQFHVEGEKGTTVCAARWKPGAALDECETFAQVQGKPRMELAGLGWGEALTTYRPFLSYNELGSMLDEGPSKLFDALAAILGLDELTDAQDALAEARKPREKAQKDAADRRNALAERCRAQADERARAALAALEADDLDALEAALAQTAAGGDGAMPALKVLARLEVPTAAAVATIVQGLRDADARVAAAAGTLAARSRDLAEILDRALQFHETYGDGACPVCGRASALDAAWHARQTGQVASLRDAARAATEARSAADQARKRAHALPLPAADLLAGAAALGLDTAAATAAVAACRTALSSADSATVATGLESAASDLEAALARLRSAASDELQRREDLWRPLALDLLAWLPAARAAAKAGRAVKPLKAAEAWLKKATESIRNERFAPIKERSQEIWNRLRLDSNVSLDDIRLTGSATKRQVELAVSVDGAAGAALGVMSQGEQNALALSLFVPRATLDESPFRFVVIDDPVQSMDPRRIDGLARVLQEAAQARQVVVFTHDDRLPEAARRLAIDATVIEVTRREGSVVELRPCQDPVARHIRDAMDVAQTDGLPAAVGRRVVPGLCRLAIESACAEAVRHRRLGRGDRHADVEELLRSVQKTNAWAALALFDDAGRGSDVLGALNKQNAAFADVLRAVNKGAHEGWPGDLVAGVRTAEKLSGWLRTRP